MKNCVLCRSYQVRGHLAAQIDPLGLNNMNPEQAKKMIIRSVTVDEKVRVSLLPFNIHITQWYPYNPFTTQLLGFPLHRVLPQKDY